MKIKPLPIVNPSNPFNMADEYISTQKAFEKPLKKLGWQLDGGGCGFGGFDIGLTIPVQKGYKGDFFQYISLNFNGDAKSCYINNISLTSKFNITEQKGKNISIKKKIILSSLSGEDVAKVLDQIAEIVKEKNKLLK